MHRDELDATSSHPDENLIVDLLAGTVTSEELPALRRHLRTCSACASLFAVLVYEHQRAIGAQPQDPGGR